MPKSPTIQCEIVSDWLQQGTHSIYAVTNEFVDGGTEDGPDQSSTTERPDDLITCLRPPDGAPSASTTYLHLKVPAHLRLSEIQLVCTANRLELFTGPLAEYQRVEHAVDILSGEEDAIGYMFNVSLDDVDVQHVTLKLFPILNEQQLTLDLFDMELRLAAKLTPIAAAATTTIDMQHVHTMLSASTRPLSEPAERLRQFLAGAGADLMASVLQPSTAERSPPGPSNEGATPPTLSATTRSLPIGDQNAAIATILRQHLDAQLNALETRVTNQLAAMERRQDVKLERILALLRPQTIDNTPLD